SPRSEYARSAGPTRILALCFVQARHKNRENLLGCADQARQDCSPAPAQSAQAASLPPGSHPPLWGSNGATAADYIGPDEHDTDDAPVCCGETSVRQRTALV